MEIKKDKIYEIIEGFDRVPSGTRIKVTDTGSAPYHVHGFFICNYYFGNMVMNDTRQKEIDELLKTREELFTAIAKNKQKFTRLVQKIKWREENKKRVWGSRIKFGVEKEG